MRAVALFLAIILLGCISTGKQVKPALSEAEMLYRSQCSLCHRLYPPEAHSYEKLEKYVKKYGQGLSVAERQELLGYLKATSK
jgi:hypothetical protein